MQDTTDHERIRVAMMITELQLGGAEQRFCDIACGLDPARFQPTVFSLGPPPSPPKDDLLKKLEAHDVPVQFAHAKGLRQFWIARSAARAWLESEQPAVVQTFLFHANVIGGEAANRLGIPLSLGIRVADPRRWRSWIERRISRRANRVVCVSESVRDFMLERGILEAKLQVIANGVDASPVEPIDRKRLEVPDTASLLVCVGRLHEQKGFDWLIENASSLLPEGDDCYLLIVGDGPQRDRLTDSITSQGLGERIKLLGWRPDARAIIAASDLLLLPSRWEGMGQGKAVLCCEAEGVSDLLGPSSAGQMLPFGECDPWRSRLTQLVEDRGARDALGRANQARILKHFSLSEMVSQFETLFGNLATES